jgi:hypothetical protein
MSAHASTTPGIVPRSLLERNCQPLRAPTIASESGGDVVQNGSCGPHAAPGALVQNRPYGPLPVHKRPYGPRRTARRALLSALLASCALLALTAAPASAAVIHPFLSSFDGAATPAGAFSLGAGKAIAVDGSGGASAGDIYIVEDSGVIDKFSAAPSPSYLCQITGAGFATSSLSECDSSAPGVPGGFSTVLNGAVVDPASGDLYVSDQGSAAVDKFNSAGVYQSQITGIEYPTVLALDHATGDLYITDAGDGTVKRFDPVTSSLTTFATPAATGGGMAVDNSSGASAGDVYVGDPINQMIDKFDSSGTLLSQIGGTPSGSFGNINGLASDPATGDLYVAQAAIGGGGGSNEVDQFDQAGTFLGRVTPSQTPEGSLDPSAVAIAPSGHLYVGDSANQLVDVFGPGILVPDVTTGSASAIGPTSATLNGTVNPAGVAVSDCHFAYVADGHYHPALPDPYSAGATVPCAESVGSGSSDVPVHANISGLAAGVTYHFRLLASNANAQNQGQDATFSTPPPPSIDAAAAQNLTPTDADLTATINPNGSDTTYHFEWGTADCSANPCTSVPIPDGDIGSGTSDVAVSQHVTGLKADITYHWRILATNANGTSGAGVDRTFIYSTTGQGLPDNRAYEQVTPTFKNGALPGDVVFGFSPVVAENGSRVVASSLQCFADSSSCNSTRGTTGSSYAFTRTPGGWLTHQIALPATQFSVNSGEGVNPDTGAGLFTAPTPPTGQDDLYLVHPDASFTDIGPLTPPAAGAQGSPVRNGASSRDFSRVVVEAEGGTWPFDATSPAGSSLYEYSGTGNTQPLLVDVSGGQGSTTLITSCGAALPEAAQGKISSDASTVFFLALGKTNQNCHGSSALASDQLYARVAGDGPGAHTVQLSQRSPSDCMTPSCSGSSASDSVFQGASADGSKAFFTSTQKLTDAGSEDAKHGDGASANGTGHGCPATTGANGCNLYLYDFSKPAGHELTAVSAGDSSANGPRVQGVVAIARDGSHVYFVAQGVLTATANSQGRSAEDGAANLYAYDASTATTSFIAGLPVSDQKLWLDSGFRAANVTPDGRFLVFPSHGNLTPDATGKSGALQIFRYDATAAGLIRISIGEGGFSDNGNRLAATPCAIGFCSEDAHIVESGLLDRTDPTMSHDGSYVFFSSPVALTPHALDDVRIGVRGDNVTPEYANNVYEWHAGHVALISDGRDTSRSEDQPPPCLDASSVCLLGTDGSGQNVFFSTADQLVPQDTDTALDYYVARVGGGFPFSPPPVPCSGDNCRPAPSAAAALPTAASVSFFGSGNASPAVARAPAKLKVLTRVVHGSRFLVAVKVPGKGRITISGAAVTTVRKSVFKAGTYKLRVTLTAKGKRALRHKRKLKFKLRVGYVPGTGASSSATVALTVKA